MQMKKNLFLILTVLAIAGCSGEGNKLNTDKFNPIINDSETVNDIKYETFLDEGYYHIIAYNKDGSIGFEIKDKAEPYILDLGYGEKKTYTPQGCYILGIVNKTEYTYIYISLISKLASVPNNFVLKIKEGIVLKQKYFNDIFYPNSTNAIYPETMINWCDKYIAFYSTPNTSIYNFGILDEDLNVVYFNESYSDLIDEIVRDNYIPISKNESLFTIKNEIFCVDMSASSMVHKDVIWKTKFTDSDIKIKTVSYHLLGDTVRMEISSIKRSGEDENYIIKINIKTGEIMK